MALLADQIVLKNGDRLTGTSKSPMTRPDHQDEFAGRSHSAVGTHEGDHFHTKLHVNLTTGKLWPEP